MRLYLRISTVIAVLFVAVAATSSTGSRLPSATAAASDAAHPQVGQVQVRLVAARIPHVDDKDVAEVTDSYVFTCGYASCTYYISRKGTKAAADYVERRENIINAAAAGVATGACAATGAGVAAATVCTAAASATAGLVLDEIKAAGERGECLRLHYYHYPVLLPAVPAADTSGYCMNG